MTPVQMAAELAAEAIVIGSLAWAVVAVAWGLWRNARTAHREKRR